MQLWLVIEAKYLMKWVLLDLTINIYFGAAIVMLVTFAMVGTTVTEKNCINYFTEDI